MVCVSSGKKEIVCEEYQESGIRSQEVRGAAWDLPVCTLVLVRSFGDLGLSLLEEAFGESKELRTVRTAVVKEYLCDFCRVVWNLDCISVSPTGATSAEGTFAAHCGCSVLVNRRGKDQSTRGDDKDYNKYEKQC